MQNTLEDCRRPLCIAVELMCKRLAVEVLCRSCTAGGSVQLLCRRLCAGAVQELHCRTICVANVQETLCRFTAGVAVQEALCSFTAGGSVQLHCRRCSAAGSVECRKGLSDSGCTCNCSLRILNTGSVWQAKYIFSGKPNTFLLASQILFLESKMHFLSGKQNTFLIFCQAKYFFFWHTKLFLI